MPTITGTAGNDELTGTEITDDIALEISGYGWVSSGDTRATFSPDGQRVAFTTVADNPDEGDVNGRADVYLLDIASGEISLASSTSDGQAINGSYAVNYQFSPDGNFLLIGATGALSASDTNGVSDLYLKNLQTGEVTLVSTSGDGSLGSGASYGGVFSPDGRYVLFTSDAANLVAGDTNGVSDVFLKDLATGAVTRVSLDDSGGQLADDSAASVITYLDRFDYSVVRTNVLEPSLGVFSPDGHRVLFAVSGVSSDAEPAYYMRDLTTGVVTPIATRPDGTPASRGSDTAVFTPDGQFVIFTSHSTELVEGISPQAYDGYESVNLFQKNLATGEVTLLSRDEHGDPTNGARDIAAVSPDGRYIAYSEGSTTPGDGVIHYTIMLYDRTSGETLALLDDVDRVSWAPDSQSLLLVYRQMLLDYPLDGPVGDGRDDIHGGAGDDVLRGLGGRDQLYGDAGNDVIYGGAGSDQLIGGLGADRMHGGQGNDYYSVDDAGDIVTEDADEGEDTVNSQIASYVLPANVENLRFSTYGMGLHTGIGNDLSNEIYANGLSGPVVLRGYGGDDFLVGSNGDDGLDGGLGADRMQGGAGDDVYGVDVLADIVIETANAGTDTVKTIADGYVLGANVENLTLNGSANISGTGNDLNNVMIGNGGNNTLLGGKGDDQLYGGAGDDILNSGTGADRMYGGAGDDIYYYGVGDTIIEAAYAGVDTVYASVNFTIGSTLENLVLIGDRAINANGNNLANRMEGNGSANVLQGGRGADTLLGMGGDDILVGGRDGDALTGGTGADTFRYLVATDSMVGASDTIMDYEAGTDRLDLSALDADTMTTGDQAFHQVEAFTGHAGELTFSFDPGTNRTTLSLDMNGDGVADMAILFVGQVTSSAGWLL